MACGTAATSYMIASEPPRFALDSNVLFYSADDSAGVKQMLARDIVARAVGCGRCFLPMQCVGEFFYAITRKRAAHPAPAARRARDFLSLFPILEPKAADASAALDACAQGRLSYWDGLLLATVGRAGCTVLLSEDMQDGATIGGVTVRNPFVGDALPEAVAALLP